MTRLERSPITFSHISQILEPQTKPARLPDPASPYRTGANPPAHTTHSAHPANTSLAFTCEIEVTHAILALHMTYF